jgi:hypothetical protein
LTGRACHQYSRQQPVRLGESVISWHNKRMPIFSRNNPAKKSLSLLRINLACLYRASSRHINPNLLESHQTFTETQAYTPSFIS